MDTNELRITQKDYRFGMFAGAMIGVLSLPVLFAAKPDLYFTFKFALVPFFLAAVPIGLRVAFMLAKKVNAVIWQIAKFGTSGALNTFVDAGVMLLLSYYFKNSLGIGSEDALFMGLKFYSLYKAISFIVANINSYYWNKYWTFDRSDSGKSQKEFVQFFAVSIIGFLVNVLVASVAFSLLPFGSTDQRQLLGAVCGTLFGLMWNFVGYKLWVFKK